MLVQSHDGAIHILLHLPVKRPDGAVKVGYTGWFVAGITWKNKKIKNSLCFQAGQLPIIRVYDPLVATGNNNISKAKGANPNPFFRAAAVQQPLVSGRLT